MTFALTRYLLQPLPSGFPFVCNLLLYLIHDSWSAGTSSNVRNMWKRDGQCYTTAASHRELYLCEYINLLFLIYFTVFACTILSQCLLLLLHHRKIFIYSTIFTTFCLFSVLLLSLLLFTLGFFCCFTFDTSPFQLSLLCFRCCCSCLHLVFIWN